MIIIQCLETYGLQLCHLLCSKLFLVTSSVSQSHQDLMCISFVPQGRIQPGQSSLDKQGVFLYFLLHLGLQLSSIKTCFPFFSLRMVIFDKEEMRKSSLHYLSPPAAKIALFPISGICLQFCNLSSFFGFTQVSRGAEVGSRNKKSALQQRFLFKFSESNLGELSRGWLFECAINLRLIGLEFINHIFLPASACLWNGA